jgi:hypothetical protein
MFDRLYRRAMRNGSRILFAFALILPILYLLNALWMFGRFGPANSLQSDWSAIWTSVVGALSIAIVPLLGALLIHRIDRYIGRGDRDP